MGLDSADVFFAYPGQPRLLGETMRNSARTLTRRFGIKTTTWEQLRVDGRIMIDQILRTVDASKAVVAEVGSLNSNVLFEVGYAIAAGKQVMLCLDTSDTVAVRNWQDLGVLASVGFTPYEGSTETLVAQFMEVRPHERTDPLWVDLLFSGNAGPREPRTIFYMPVGARGDAGKALDRTLLLRKNLSVNSADEEVQGLAPLSWYAAQIYQSSAALVHLRGITRSRALVHNARASLFAGMATALRLPTLLVAEESFEPPIDYRDLLFRYPTAKQLAQHTETWLDHLPALSGARAVGRKQLAAELPVRRFGEYVAENEKDQLGDYFVETGQYEAVLSSQTAVFIGRKGTGKTANMLTAAETLRSDRRNLVTVIKPSGYELESLIAVLLHLPQREAADYLLDALWRYMLLTEIASSAVREAEARPAGIASDSPMEALRTYMDDFAGGSDTNFAVRLERLIDELLSDLDRLPTGVEDAQAWLSGRLHTDSLSELRKVMGLALKDRARVALLIDNLDKAWERSADREQQSRMILALLSAVGRVEREFRKEDAWRDKVNVTLAVFLRADIFDVVRQHAREPDKITTLQVQWDDQELLARIIEDRYIAQRGEDARAEDLWSEFFCDRVGEVPTRDFLLWRSLPRPRDLVYLCNACVLTAMNRRHSRIEEDDVLAAQDDYSRFAFDALLVEGSSSEELDNILLQFAGTASKMALSDARSLIAGSQTAGDVDETLNRLLRASFLGIETKEGTFDYPAAEQSAKKAYVLASRLEGRIGREAQVAVHPAFRPYLGIDDET